MLIEQTFETELRGSGPPRRTCTPTSVGFMTKQKSLRKIF